MGSNVGSPWAHVLDRSSRDELDAVEQLLRRHLGSGSTLLERTARQLVDAGGKRLRAVLAILGGRVLRVTPSVARSAACAAELVHTAALLHDDLLDGTDMRRGEATPRLTSGAGVALLTGDYCLARAFGCLGGAGDSRARSLSTVVAQMATGEALQMELSARAATRLPDYFKVVDLKTGSLCAWAASVGDDSSPDSSHLAQFGLAVGRLLQILNDVKDYDCRRQNPGRDIANGTMNIPLLLAMDANPALAESFRRLALVASPHQAAVLAVMREVVNAGGLDAALTVAHAVAQQASSELADLTPDAALMDLKSLPAWLMTTAAPMRHVRPGTGVPH